MEERKNGRDDDDIRSNPHYKLGYVESALDTIEACVKRKQTGKALQVIDDVRKIIAFDPKAQQ